MNHVSNCVNMSCSGHDLTAKHNWAKVIRAFRIQIHKKPCHLTRPHFLDHMLLFWSVLHLFSFIYISHVNKTWNYNSLIHGIIKCYQDVCSFAAATQAESVFERNVKQRLKCNEFYSEFGKRGCKYDPGRHGKDKQTDCALIHFVCE